MLESTKIYYGGTFFNEQDLEERRIKHNVQLEYYEMQNKPISEDKTNYGIEIIKKEYSRKNMTVETNKLENITNSKDIVIKIIETLKRNKVTPIGLQDVIEDLLNKKVTE